MNRFFYSMRCKFREELPKKQTSIRSEGRPLTYYSLDPEEEELMIRTKTFQIKYEQNLSLIAKLLLNSFQKKYIYYAIDDILYSLRSNPIERDNILAILYSPVLSLQNNFLINFFDIWIDEIYISEVSKVNKFLTSNHPNLQPFNYVTIKLLYKPKPPIKKQKSLW